MAEAESLALSDTLYDCRPSTKVSDRMLPLYERGSRASLALSALQDFPFYAGNLKLIGLGNEILEHCADELEAVVKELRTMNAAIAEEIAQQEVAHG